jgi:hypothetical protein
MIPRYFHFVFGLRAKPQPLHLVHYLCLRSCLEIQKPEKLFFHFYHLPYGRYWELIRDSLVLNRVEPISTVEKFRYRDTNIGNRYRYAHHADFIRLDVLNQYGGVYADLDTLFVNPYPARLFQEEFVLGREPDVFCPVRQQTRSSLCNALILAKPNSRFGTTFRESMEQALDGTWSNHSCQLASELAMQHPDWLHIEPQVSFYKYIWTKEGIASLLTESPDTPGASDDDVLSIHLWAHLWWSWLRRDFTTFHAGRLTESFIASTDTTYNVIARQFLPPPIERSSKHFLHRLRENLCQSLS